MTEEEKKAIENIDNILNKKIDLKIYSHTDYKIIKRAYKLYTDRDIQTLLNLVKKQQEEIEKKDTNIALLEQLNKDLQKDFDSYKKDEDIHYLDGVHHKQLVEKSVGQKIDKPEDCWFDVFEVKVIKNNMLYGITTNEDFITLKQISDSDVDNCITVIAESPLSGAIYRYNNDGTKEWQLIGTMLGYA